MFLTQDFIKVWLGPHYLLSGLTLLAILINFYLGVILLPIWVYREATGLYQQTKYVMVLTAIINLILSIFMAKSLGITGVLLASAISRLVTYFWYEPILLFKTYFSASSVVYFKQILNNVLLTVAIALVEYYTVANYTVHGWISLLIKAVLVFVISLALTLLFYSRTGGIKLITNRVKSFLNKG